MAVPLERRVQNGAAMRGANTSAHWCAPALALALAGCVGPVRPATLVDMRHLSSDPQERSEQIESSQVRAGPQDRAGVSPAAQKAETIAATAAAALGILFSGSKTVLIGAGGSFDENRLVDPLAAQREGAADRSGRGAAEEGAGAEADADEGTGELEETDPGELVPWIRLRPDPDR